MSDHLSQLSTFVRVAELGSLSAAARALSVSLASVSRQIAVLEDRLGARLLERTTRRLALTEGGRTYLERARRILAEVVEADLAFSQFQSEPVGNLMVSGPTLFGQHYLSAAIPAFLARHQRVGVVLDLSDRFVDLVEEGIDVAVRIGEPADSSLIARRLGSFRRVVCAAPAYLAVRGAPAHPEALIDHDCVLATMMQPADEWRFVRAGERVVVRVAGRLRASNGDAALQGALGGAGIVLAQSWQIRDHVRAGRLKVLLDDWQTPEVAIQALYPSARHLSPKVRAFVDFLAERWRGEAFGRYDQAADAAA
jgi:DNA-binding transcriptional LysR family regulator